MLGHHLRQDLRGWTSPTAIDLPSRAWWTTCSMTICEAAWSRRWIGPWMVLHSGRDTSVYIRRFRPTLHGKHPHGIDRQNRCVLWKTVCEFFFSAYEKKYSTLSWPGPTRLSTDTEDGTRGYYSIIRCHSILITAKDNCATEISEGAVLSPCPHDEELKGRTHKAPTERARTLIGSIRWWIATCARLYTV